MSYADRLQKLVEYQTNIRSALEAKGATISSDATLKDFPSAVDTITGDYTGPTPVDIMENGWAPYYSLIKNTTKIMKYAFTSASEILEISLPYCSQIGDYAFQSCNNAKLVDLPLCTSLGMGAFMRCGGVSFVNIPEMSTLSGQVFSHCFALKSVYAPAIEKILDGCFYYCNSLSVLSLPMCSLLSGGVFEGCSKLERVHFNSLSKISVYTYSPTFRGCANLRSLYIKNSSMCSLDQSTAFTSTPIAGYWNTSYCTQVGQYGSIFVPYSLLDAYKVSTNWAYFSNRFAASIPLSATNLSESDSITAFVEGKESPVPLEVSSAEFTYSVYSKYPKYTGTQADVDENGEINISLPTDGVTLTVNTNPEDATVRITEDGIMNTYTKTKLLNSGDTVDYMAYTPINTSIPYYYGEKHNTVTVNDDEVFEVKLSRKGFKVVNAGNVYDGVSELKTNILNIFRSITKDFVSTLSCENSAFESGYFAYTTPSTPIKLSFTVFSEKIDYPDYGNIVFRISTVLDENTYSNYRNLSSASVLQDGNVLCVDVSESEKEYEIELEPNTTYYFQELYACYGASSLGSKRLMHIKGLNLYEDLGNCVLLTASNSEKVYGLVNGKMSEGILLAGENEEFSYTAYTEGKPKVTGTQSDMNGGGEVTVTFPETGISLEVNSEIPDSYISITQDGVWTEYNTTTMVNNGDEVTIEHFNPFYENYSITQTLNEDTNITVNGLNIVDSGNILSVDVAKWYPETKNMSVTKLASGSMYLAIQGDEIPLAGDYKAYMIEITCPIRCKVNATVIAGVDTTALSANRNIIRFSETLLDVDNFDIWDTGRLPNGCIDLINSTQAYNNGVTVSSIDLNPNKKYYLYIYSRRLYDRSKNISVPVLGVHSISFTK